MGFLTVDEVEDVDEGGIVAVFEISCSLYPGRCGVSRIDVGRWFGDYKLVYLSENVGCRSSNGFN